MCFWAWLWPIPLYLLRLITFERLFLRYIDTLGASALCSRLALKQNYNHRKILLLKMSLSQHLQARQQFGSTGIALLMLISLFSLPAIGSEVNIKRLYKDDWIRMKSDNFDVFSNASKKQTVLMIEDIENFSFFVSTILGFKQEKLARKIPIILAKNQSSFQSLGMPKNAAGLFSSAEGGVIFARADKFRSSSKGASWGRGIVLHELTHLLMRNSAFKSRPPWYNEGIAEYFSTYVRKKNRIYLGNLSVLENLFYEVVKKSGGSFENVDSKSLFSVTQDDLMIGKKLTRAQKSFVNKFYTRSLSVVHYLNASPQRRQQLYQLLTLLDRGYEFDESFKHTFKLSYEEFDDQVNNYIGGKSVLARVFNINENGIEFPHTATQSIETSKFQALTFLYSKISLLSGDVLSDGAREKMNKDIEALIPDFFAE